MNRSVRFFGLATAWLIAYLAVWSVPGFSAKKYQTSKAHANGRQIYMSNCEACHMLGSNVIKPEKELITSSKIASRSVFRDYISEKHGLMPAFKQVAENPQSLKDLHSFVHSLKQQDWSYDAYEAESPEIEMKEPGAGQPSISK